MSCRMIPVILNANYCFTKRTKQSPIPIFLRPNPHHTVELLYVMASHVTAKPQPPYTISVSLSATVTRVRYTAFAMADGGSSIVAAVMRGRAGVGPCVHASEPQAC